MEFLRDLISTLAAINMRFTDNEEVLGSNPSCPTRELNLVVDWSFPDDEQLPQTIRAVAQLDRA